MIRSKLSMGVLSLGLLASLPLSAVEFTPDEDKFILNERGIVKDIGQSDLSPYAGRDFPTRVFWGDTHLHTAVSVDAGTMNRGTSPP